MKRTTRLSVAMAAALVLLCVTFGVAELAETCGPADSFCHDSGSPGGDRPDRSARDPGTHHGAHCLCVCHLVLAPIVADRPLEAFPISYLEVDLELAVLSRPPPRLFRPPIPVPA
ncbi:MAG: hypothetical protein HY815_03810 [Candidatus Riflebacteria bacterium]|nr:hypothetical protein [Candidatus Riflebacteria bacterium]